MKNDVKNKTVLKHTHIIVKRGDSGPATEDVQRKLNKLGYLKDSNIDSFYGDVTAAAVLKFSEDNGLAPIEDVSEKVWAKLVDASFKLGDRNLFLRIPYFHGNDVLQLQKALGSLGFNLNKYDGIFGTSTERAVRQFQINMGLPSDGIIGSQTFMALKNLKFTWSDKKPLSPNSGENAKNVWRASEVLENNSICLYGTGSFTRDVAVRMSNLSRATNPFSKILCSNALSVAPDKDTILLRISLPDEEENFSCPKVIYAKKIINHDDIDDEVNEKIDNLNTDNFIEDSDSLVKRLKNAIVAAKQSTPIRLTIILPSKSWNAAGEDRSAQHYAITCLDALCTALNSLKNEKVSDK